MPKFYKKGFIAGHSYANTISIVPYKDSKDWDGKCLPSQIEKFAEEHGVITKTDVKFGGNISVINDANIYIYFTKEASTLEEAQEALILKASGSVESEMYLEGYSEYTIISYDLKDFKIGNHNLYEIIMNHVGQYMHFILEC